MSEGARALAPRERRLVRLVAAIVLGDWPEVTRLRQAAPPGEPDRAWREAVLQTHLFGGFPRLVEAYEVLERAGGLGVPDPTELEENTSPTRDLTREGADLFDAIYTDQAQSVRERLASFHPDFATWIARHAYGRVLSRPGLPASVRELCAVGALLVTGQDRQLASHARGAVRLGAEPAQVVAVLELLGDLLTPEIAARGRAVLERFAR